MPRKYSMERRTAAVDETRQRIVDATVELHNEKGVLATSMQDIAARAGVSLGTVYRHFPTVDDLIPACGGRVLELMPPPTSEVFSSLEGPARIQAFFAALYAHYEDAQRPYAVGLAEAEHLPVLREHMDRAIAYQRSIVAEALQPFSPTEALLGLAIALADFNAWHAFNRAGFDSATAAATVSEIILSYLSAKGGTT